MADVLVRLDGLDDVKRRRYTDAATAIIVVAGLEHARMPRPVWRAIRDGGDVGAAPVPLPRAEAPPHLNVGLGNGTAPARADDLKAGTGPGSKLMRMLKVIGITSAPGCSCRARARLMNEWGPAMCRQQLETIVAWLQEEARKRELPFSRVAARIMVRRAIRRAEREGDR